MKKIHFIGLGGIGISALAKIYLSQGYKISGSDLNDSDILKNLKDQGSQIFIGPHSGSFISSDIGLVVFSPAIGEDNPELKEAKKNKIPALSYPEALGKLTSDYWTIAVSGTHGKSTTTSMLALAAIKAGLDPTVIVGTKLKELGGSNARVGKSKYLIIEADEFNASFLNYWPKAIILTNIEEDHLDYYKNLNHILKTFQDYINHLPKNGVLVVNKDDKNINKLNITSNWKTSYFGSFQEKDFDKIKNLLNVPGRHNIFNALSVLTLGRELGIKDEVIFKSLSEFQGTWRRFEIIKEKPFILISDYAHHPTEVKATIKATKEKFLNRKIICVYQPHQYQRTRYLFNDFVSSFDEADEIILSEIFNVAGREDKNTSKSISSFDLTKKIKERGKKAIFAKNLKETEKILKNKIEKNSVVLVMGAGDIWNIVKNLSTS